MASADDSPQRRYHEREIWELSAYLIRGVGAERRRFPSDDTLSDRALFEPPISATATLQLR